MPHMQIHHIIHIRHINFPVDYFSLSLFLITISLFPCFILQLIHFQSYGKFGLGDLFSITALAFELDVVMFQECNCLTQVNNKVKLPHFTQLEYEHFFKRDTFLPILVVVICIVTDVVVPALHFTILKLNELSTNLALLLEPSLLVVAHFFSMREVCI